MDEAEKPGQPSKAAEAARGSAPPAGSGDGGVRGTVKLDLGGTVLTAEVVVPKGPTTVRMILPVLRGFSEAVVKVAVDKCEGAGKRKVSCKAGCGACCRQLVPISEPEAHELAAVVAAMPEPRRGVVLGRFAAAREKLRAAGLLEDVAQLPPAGSDKKTELGLAYFGQGIACPFLEEESCSIYPDRPLVCREYLVTNDPKHCAQPNAEVMDLVPIPGGLSTPLMKASGGRVALVLALEWAATHAEPAPKEAGPEVLMGVLRLASRTEKKD